jgi:insulin-like growth factor 2 mRNA-binding protein 1
MEQEAKNTNKGETPLKILAHNNLIGRIIGKSGASIKNVMEETNSKITVSSIQDVSSFNLERTITVKGSVESMSKAEAMISAKMRQSLENDLAAMAPQSMMFPGLPPMAMMSTLGTAGGYPRGPRSYNSYNSSYHQPLPPPPSGVYPGSVMPEHQGSTQENTYLYIPNAAVGAVIGTKGNHIRNLIRFSGSSVKIAPLNKDEPVDHATERKVTIIGTPEAQWKAQFLIFEKLREEGFAGNDDVRLKAEIMVPSSQVGRIIGKGGQNVREMQRVTGSVIKLPEESQNTEGEETPVHIIGTFYSVQSAQRRVRALVNSILGPIPQRRRSQRGGDHN